MSIVHHPGEELLVAYASGGMPEPVALVVATHLAFCAQCRAFVAAAECTGGVLLEELKPEPLAPSALDAVLSRLSETQEAPRAPAPRGDFGVPEPLAAYLKRPLAQTRWIPVTTGLAFKPVLARGRMRVNLIRSAPGRGTDMHTHRGTELTLVLAGGFTDATGQYGPGDLQTATPETLHMPIADPGEDCINLAVTDAPLVFGRWPVSLLAKLFGF